MSYETSGYFAELAHKIQTRHDKVNFTLSVEALMIGLTNLIPDNRLQNLSHDFWDSKRAIFKDSTHHFLAEKTRGINLTWWCERFLIPRLVTVKFKAAPPESVEYIFSEGWLGVADHNKALSVILKSPSDVSHPDWEATIKEYDSEGLTIGPPRYALPRGGKHHKDDDFVQLVNEIQDGLNGGSYARVP